MSHNRLCVCQSLRINREFDPSTALSRGESLRKVTPVRENAPIGLHACRYVILISRTRRRNARPYLRSRRKVDVPMMSPRCPALGTPHAPRSIPRFNPPARIWLCRHFIASAQLTPVSFTRYVTSRIAGRCQANNFSSRFCESLCLVNRSRANRI